VSDTSKIICNRDYQAITSILSHFLTDALDSPVTETTFRRRASNEEPVVRILDTKPILNPALLFDIEGKGTDPMPPKNSPSCLAWQRTKNILSHFQGDHPKGLVSP
jgi:hypothetical protein